MAFQIRQDPERERRRPNAAPGHTNAVTLHRIGNPRAARWKVLFGGTPLEPIAVNAEMPAAATAKIANPDAGHVVAAIARAYPSLRLSVSPSVDAPTAKRIVAIEPSTPAPAGTAPMNVQRLNGSARQLIFHSK